MEKTKTSPLSGGLATSDLLSFMFVGWRICLRTCLTCMASQRLIPVSHIDVSAAVGLIWHKRLQSPVRKAWQRWEKKKKVIKKRTKRKHKRPDIYCRWSLKGETNPLRMNGEREGRGASRRGKKVQLALSEKGVRKKCFLFVGNFVREIFGTRCERYRFSNTLVVPVESRGQSFII